MGRRSVAADIEASPGVVFALYTDPARLREWQPDLKGVEANGPLDQPGTRWTAKYGGPFTMRGVVEAVEPGSRHVQRFREMAGLVSCLTTALFEASGTGTKATFDFDYKVAGGPIGRRLDDMVGGEIVARFTKDIARLKEVAESSAGR